MNWLHQRSNCQHPLDHWKSKWVPKKHLPLLYWLCQMEKEIATHSSTLAWRIPGMEETGGLPSMGSHRVEHSWHNLAAAAAAKPLTCVDHNKLWKILKVMGIPDHLTCLLRNLYAGQEAMVRTGHGTTDWFQIGKGVCQYCILSPYLLNLYAENIMRNTRLDEA